MCFIKVGDPLSPCEHSECRKALEAFKGSNCMYNYPMQANNNAASQYLNVKRNRPGSPQNYGEISEEIFKKIKRDENFLNNGTFSSFFFFWLILFFANFFLKTSEIFQENFNFFLDVF